MNIRQILEAVSLDDINKYFKEVSPERIEKVKKSFSGKNNELDKRGSLILTILKKENLNDKQFSVLMYIFKKLNGKVITSLKPNITYKEIKEVYNENKNEEPKENKPKSNIKSKDMGEEVLFFPQTYEEMRSFSAWMAKKDTEGTNVNHWCVAARSEEGADAFKDYKDFGNFVVVVKKKDGNINWNERYLYYARISYLGSARGEDGKGEFANKNNTHIKMADFHFVLSKKTESFLKNYIIHSQKRKYKNKTINKEKAEDKKNKSIIRKLFNGNTLRVTYGTSEEKILAKHFNENNITKIKELIIEKILYEAPAHLPLKEIEILDINNKTLSANMILLIPKIERVGTVILRGSSSRGLIASLFQGCRNLKSVNRIILPNSISELVTLFDECTNLEKAPNMNLSKAKAIGNIFTGCNRVKMLPSYVFSKEVKISQRSFGGMTSLKTLDMSNPNAWVFPRENNEYTLPRLFMNSPLDEETRMELEKRNPDIKFQYKN